MAASATAAQRKLAERARQISDGRLSPAVPRDAATVILLRQAGSGVEAFLLRRTAELEFAPGAYVFPGGSVDARDADEIIGWAGPPPADFGVLLDVPPDHARALVCAAVRETFEESGVLLAGPANSPADLVSDSAVLAGDRHALLTGSASLGKVHRRRGLVLRADLLTPWARWITPEASPRRFDTWFFAAALPPGQTATAAPEGFGDHAEPGESESGTERFVGQKVKVVLRQPVENQRHWTGALKSFTQGIITLEPSPGRSVQFALDQVEKANLKFEW